MGEMPLIEAQNLKIAFGRGPAAVPVAAIITEKGIARAPYEDSLRGLAAQEAGVLP